MDFVITFTDGTQNETGTGGDTYSIEPNGVLKLSRAEEKDRTYYSPSAWRSVVDSTEIALPLY